MTHSTFTAQQNQSSNPTSRISPQSHFFPKSKNSYQPYSRHNPKKDWQFVGRDRHGAAWLTPDCFLHGWILQFLLPFSPDNSFSKSFHISNNEQSSILNCYAPPDKCNWSNKEYYSTRIFFNCNMIPQSFLTVTWFMVLLTICFLL